MQFKFLAALLLVGACFVQVSVAHPQNYDLERNIIDDLIANAKEAIEKFKEILETEIKKALDSFNKLGEQVQSIADAAIAAAKEQFNKLVADANKQIQEIKDKAEELGANISDCLSQSEDDFENLFAKFVQDELTCVQKEVDEALRIISEGVQIVIDAYKSVEDLPEKLKACGTGLSSITCINKVILDIAKLQIDVPGKISNKIQEVTKFVSGIKVRLEVCATTQLGSAALEAGKIVAQVAKCASEKFGADLN